jgi:hypothetical protein
MNAETTQQAPQAKSQPRSRVASLLLIDAAADDNPLSVDRCFAFRLRSELGETETTRLIEAFESQGFFAEALASSATLGSQALAISSVDGRDALPAAREALRAARCETIALCGPIAINEDGRMPEAPRAELERFLMGEIA